MAAAMFQSQANIKQLSSHAYTSSYHPEWDVGPTLHGGCIAAVIHLVASKHLTTTLSKYNQPDILTMHVEYLRFCSHEDFEIAVSDLKCGAASSNIQVTLSQDGKVKATSFVTSTNFDVAIGPSCDDGWPLHPAPGPKPDFSKVLSNRPDDNWIPGRVSGEIIPFTKHFISLAPRKGHTTTGVVDVWQGYTEKTMDTPCVAFLCDVVPSMSDTLLGNDAFYNAHRMQAKMKAWADDNPGKVCELESSIAAMISTPIIDNTLSLDIEFKKRLPDAGLRWIFHRTTTRKLQTGRMDLDVTICDEQMDMVCQSRQICLVMDAQRRFRPSSKKKSNL